MKKFKRLFYYLLINILVSACTTLLVLGFWEQTHPLTSGASPLNIRNLLNPGTVVIPQLENTAEGTTAVIAQTSAPLPPGSTPLTVPQPSALPGQDPQVVITNVFGVGDLSTERVRLERRGEGDLSMDNWKLADEDGHVYIFPTLVLFPQGAIDVYTQSGSDRVVALYWGLDQAVWRSGEKVTLVDSVGTVRATLIVP